MDEIFKSIQSCIDNKELYMDNDDWFNWLQDACNDVTDKQKKEIDDKVAKGKKKTFTRKILKDYKLHSDLYTIGEELQKLMKSKRDEHFPKLPEKSTPVAHQIGSWIAANRRMLCVTEWMRSWVPVRMMSMESLIQTTKIVWICLGRREN
jgi:hypothetical protein